MKLAPSSKVAQAGRIASRVVDGQAVVIVIDRQRLHTLNSVGTFLWNRAERAVRVEELSEALAEEFEVTPEAALGDVIEFVSELVELGALELVEAQ